MGLVRLVVLYQRNMVIFGRFGKKHKKDNPANWKNCQVLDSVVSVGYNEYGYMLEGGNRMSE